MTEDEAKEILYEKYMDLETHYAEYDQYPKTIGIDDDFVNALHVIIQAFGK